MKIIFSKPDSINKWLFVLLGFFIPLSTAVTNMVLGLIVIFWVLDNLSDRFKRWILVLKTNPVAFMGLVVFLIHGAGLIYTNGEKERAVASLMDGVKFLFISMAMIYFKDKQYQSTFLFSFIIAMSITLVLSYLIWMNLIPNFIHIKGGPQDCNVFLNHIAQNIFMAFMVFVTAVWSRTAIGYGKKIFWGVFSLLALYNVLFLVAGRTGHLVLGILFLYYFISWDRLKSIIVAGLVLLTLGVFAWANPSNSFILRGKTAIEEIKEWEYGKKASGESSSGLRLEFFFNSLKIIKNNPVFGTGTGGFEKAYRDSIKDIEMNPTDNPHNEYLMMAGQFGLIGLSALLAFFWIQWHNAVFLENDQQTIIARGFVLTILFASMVSSPLLDHAEGWFFAFMSAFLFSGLDTRLLKKKMGIA